MEKCFKHRFVENSVLADNTLSLYNGLRGSNYTDALQLEFNTLENAIYMNVKNDISFIIGDNLNLYEHQSTWNPNMHLRNLIYITSVYQNYVELKQDKSIYGNSIISLPFPEFVVLYNGTEERSEYRQKAEVIRMSIFEYDEEKEIGRIRKEEREVGFIQGMIVTLKENGDIQSDVVLRVMERFGFEKGKAEEVVEKYWN